MDLDRIFEKAFSPNVIEEAVSIHFNKFTERGLQVVAGVFKREGHEVESITPNDKLKKRDGIPTKSVLFEFKNGNRLEMFIAFPLKDDQKNLRGDKLTAALKDTVGNVYQVKINGTKAAFQMPRTGKAMTRQALIKIARLLDKAKPPKPKAAKISADDRKKMIRATQASESRFGKKPTSAAGKLNMTNEWNETWKKELEEAQKSLEKERKETTRLSGEKSELQSELDAINQEVADLSGQLETIQGAA